MNAMKKLGLAACAAMTLMAQAALAEGTDQGFLLSQVGAGYNQFSRDLGVLCGVSQPFEGPGEPTWYCTSESVDHGIKVATGKEE